MRVKSTIFTLEARACLPMRILLTISLFLVQVSLQAQFTDDFNDGDFTSAPVWTGSTADFIVNGSNELQLNNTIAATSYLSSAFSAPSLNTFEWRFRIQQTFAPSGSNYGKVYLASDQSDLTQPLNGYYLQFGEALSTDAIRLYQQTGTVTTLVCSGTIGAIASSFNVGVRVLRDNAGNWSLYADYTGGTNYILEGTGTDATYNTSSFLGVVCIYTASNANKFFFDDFYMGPLIVDTTPPDALSATPLSTTTVDILFDEAMDSSTVNNENNYLCNNGIGVPVLAVRDASNFSLVHLTFANPFVTLTNYDIFITNMDDMSSNTLLSDTVSFQFALPGTAAWRNVVINEIMADPSPVVGLPDAEYIELYNPTATVYDLNGWTLSDGSSTATLGTYTLFPNSYVILCSAANATALSAFGNVLSCSLPSLNNDADNLTLKNASTTLIDQVSYLDDWYQDANKMSGGYSLELINPQLPCANAFNWIGSNDVSGGTPGMQNSVYDVSPDTVSPQITSAIAINDSTLILTFNESVDTLTILSASYVFSGGLSVSQIDPLNNSVQLTVQPVLDSGLIYTLQITGVSDCSGNTSPLQTQVVLPQAALKGDVIINEILFDPVTGGNDYVEIVNISQKIIGMSAWQLANHDNDTIDNLKDLLADEILLYPGDYLLLTSDLNDLVRDFPNAATDRVHIMPSLPSYNNDSGTVYLISGQNRLIDKFSYTEDMHFALLQSTEGVSLERIRFDVPTQQNDNWHSAAESAGWGTPGYLNSQWQQENEGEGTLEIVPETFSPDNDGYNDLLQINYTFTENGYVANVTIYDTYGRTVRLLAQNELLASSGTLTWDGINEKREKAPVGIYVIYFEVYRLDGTLKRFKRSCVLATKF